MVSIILAKTQAAIGVTLQISAFLVFVCTEKCSKITLLPSELQNTKKSCQTSCLNKNLHDARTLLPRFSAPGVLLSSTGTRLDYLFFFRVDVKVRCSLLSAGVDVGSSAKHTEWRGTYSGLLVRLRLQQLLRLRRHVQSRLVLCL